MRCHNLALAAKDGMKNALNRIAGSGDGCPASLQSLTASIILIVVLTISFYYHNIRRGLSDPNSKTKSPLVFAPLLSRFPYEPVIFLLYASYTWMFNFGCTILHAFLDHETRTKMWEGSSRPESETVFFMAYFFFLEIMEITMGQKFVLKSYYAEKEKALMLPVTEEKEVVVVEPLEDEKKEMKISIYEAIAFTPAPTEAEIAALSDSESAFAPLLDTESSATSPSRPSLWQRIRSYIVRGPVTLTAESVLGRFYIMAFFKCNLIFWFASAANRAVCALSPEKYFDDKSSDNLLLLLCCALWTVRAGWLIIEGVRFARTELKERISVAF